MDGAKSGDRNDKRCFKINTMNAQDSKEYKDGYQAGWQAREKIMRLPTMGIIRAEKITGIVCGYFQVDLQSLVNSSRKQEFAYPRHLCMYFLKKYSSLSLKVIGKMFGRDHTSVLHSVRVMEDLLQVDDIVQNDIPVLDKTIIAQIEVPSSYVSPGLKEEIGCSEISY